MSRKRCFSMVSCELRSKCEHAHVESKSYFQPTNVGEHCHNFQPLSVEYDHHDKIMALMRGGAA